VALSRVSAEGAFDLLRSCSARKRCPLDFRTAKGIACAYERRHVAEAQESLWMLDRGPRVSPTLDLN
jgi:hypothetical protein